MDVSWKECIGVGAVGAIDRATFSFWRNPRTTTWDLLFPKSMGDIYNEASTGDTD